MPSWTAVFPLHAPKGAFGVHIFIVHAEHRGEARRLALAQADLPDARRHRRNAVLAKEGLTVTALPSDWGVPAV
ncbi:MULTISPECIES: hypothetical protein [unclassified Streptomyces]|uniref:hypothetical protein n=1 Tax=unclassified Streptomyces TaxID=2593676 RepID=UPI003815071F